METPPPISGIPIAFWRRQLRHDLAGSLSLVITTLVASFFVSLAPRVLEHAAASDLRQAVADATPEQRNLIFELQSRIGAASQQAPFSLVEQRGELLIEDDVPDSVAAIVRERRWVYDSPTFEVSSFPDQDVGPFPTTFRFRYQDGVEDELQVVRGRLPGSPEPLLVLVGDECPSGVPVAEFAAEPDQNCQVVEVPVFETAVTEQTASDMMVDVGDQVTLGPSVGDTKWLLAREGVLDSRFVLRISGIVELSDPSGDFWYADSSLHRPRIFENPDFRFVTAVGLIRPDRYGQLVDELPVVAHDYAWRYLVDPDQVAASDLEQLGRDLDKLDPGGVDTVTGLPEVLADHALQRRLSERLLSIGTGGVVATAVVALLAIAIMRSVRLRAVSSLVVDRGASRRQLLLDGLRTGVALTVPAAAVGWVLAWGMLPWTESGASLQLAISVSVGATLGVVATAMPSDSATSRSGGRRVVAEVAVLIAATGAVVLARRRGETAVVDADLDLLVAAAPSLLAAAAGLVAVRITAPAMRAAAAAVKRRRGVGAFVGFRRQVVQPLSARFPIVVLTMAVSTAVFSSVLVTSITAGQVGASWSAVGADYRVETVTRGVPLPPSVDAAIGESGGTSAGVAVIRDVRVTGSDRSAVVDVLAIDSVRYGEVLADATVGREALGPLLGAPPGEREPVPAVVVGRWPAGKPFTEGEAMTARVGAFQPQFVVAGVVEQFPSVDPARQTLVVDRAALTGVTDHRTTRSAAVFVDSGIGEGDLRELVEGPFARLVSRSDQLSAIAGDPLSIWTRRALWGIVVWSLAMSVVAAVSAVMMSAQARRRDLAVLRVLGLTSRDGAAIAAIEQVPVIVIALLTGVMVGAIAPHLIEPTLDFASFAGGAARVGVEVDAGTIVALCVAMLVVIVLGVAASVRAVDRSEAAKMLRVGDER